MIEIETERKKGLREREKRDSSKRGSMYKKELTDSLTSKPSERSRSDRRAKIERQVDLN